MGSKFGAEHLSAGSEDSSSRSCGDQTNKDINYALNMNKIKTSTPIQDTTLKIKQMDISNISCVRPSNCSTDKRMSTCHFQQSSVKIDSNRKSILPTIDGSKFGPRKSQNTKTKKKRETKATLSDDNEAYIAFYNKLMQSILVDDINHQSQSRAKDEIDEQVASLQKRITRNLEILYKTKEQIQKINFNFDIENHLRLYGDYFKMTKDNINKTKTVPTDKQSKAIAKELEKMSNKISCEYVVLPDSLSGITDLNETLKETLGAYEKLSKSDSLDVNILNENKEACELFKEHTKLDSGVNAAQNCRSQ
ncbi:uncharacterized protein LOC142331143 isoform X2 [Lycorma delicatula]|uniref:uncharacterized protein LOC142331143 isoform X2 n=1 Tax=Lycorma delicatula TaxID=130591 RepID=UPI003F50DE4C